MTIDTQRLRELAQKATPGSWYSKWPEERCTWVDIGNSRYPVAYTGDCFEDAPNAEYIAAANPATVLALLDEIDRLRADKAHVTTMFESTSKLLSNAIDLVEKKNSQLVLLRKIEAAARNLAKVKGRHNSEIAMNKLLETLK